MKTIPLNHGLEAIVDDEDYEELSKYKWYVGLPGLDVMRARGILMSREIMKAPDGLEVDHKDGNGLDMQRSNLRLCTSSQNNQNRKKRKGTTSKYKGVFGWTGRWQVGIKLQDTFGQTSKKHLGYFTVEEEAAKTYDEAARKHFGEFACLNFPGEGERSCL